MIVGVTFESVAHHPDACDEQHGRQRTQSQQDIAQQMQPRDSLAGAAATAVDARPAAQQVNPDGGGVTYQQAAGQERGSGTCLRQHQTDRGARFAGNNRDRRQRRETLWHQAIFTDYPDQLSMAIAVVVGEASQIYFGTTLGLAVHVTTAMLLWAFSLVLAIKVWAPTWKLAA